MRIPRARYGETVQETIEALLDSTESDTIAGEANRVSKSTYGRRARDRLEHG